MAKGIFITGTGTDIGKTFVTALIVKKLKTSGENAAYYKAALSGADEVNGKLVPGDADYVYRITGLKGDPSAAVSYTYKNAYSPHLAAIVEGNPVELDTIAIDFKAISEDCDYVTVEGSGGIICPIRYDKKIMLEDIIKRLKLSTIIVADAGLGTINSVYLTVHYLNFIDIPVKGIIFNNFEDGDPIMEDNVKMVEELTKIPVIAKVHKNDTELDIDAEYLKSLYDEI